MRIHTFPLTCDVCGGDGLGTIQTAGAAWDSRNRIAHSDPQICRDNLAAERQRLERMRQEQEAAA